MGRNISLLRSFLHEIVHSGDKMEYRAAYQDSAAFQGRAPPNGGAFQNTPPPAQQGENFSINQILANSPYFQSRTPGTEPSLGRMALQGTIKVGTYLMEGGTQLLRQTNIIGEGPKPLRALCFLGGLALIIVSGISALNIFAFLTSPCSYMLEIYLAFFGVAITIIEAKDLESLERLKPFIELWFKFLTVPAGKGGFYLFCGSLAISLLSQNILLFFVGIYLAVMGVICIMVHLGLRHQLARQGIEIQADEEPRNIALGQPLTNGQFVMPPFANSYPQPFN